MVYFYAYLATGGIVCLMMVLLHRRSAHTRLVMQSDLLDTLHPERKTRRYRILSQQVVPLLAGIAMVLGWPVGLVMQAKDMADRFAQARREKISVFTVKRADLRQRMSVAEIEQCEFVLDPLGATPDLPFGHVHAVWEKFLQGMAPGDQLWRFDSQWTPSWGPTEQRRGYAIKRRFQVVAFFTAQRKRLSTSDQ